MSTCRGMAKAEWDPYKRVENDATHTAEVGPRFSVPKLENTIKTGHLMAYVKTYDLI